MATRQALTLITAAAVLGGGLALAPAATAAPAAPATVAAKAKPKNTQCVLKTDKWTTCKKAGSITVKKGKTLEVELVSSGNKPIDLRIANQKSKALAKKYNVRPGSGYTLFWNNSGKAKKVKIQADRDQPVKINANIRYRIK